MQFKKKNLSTPPNFSNMHEVAGVIEASIQNEMLNVWYPQCIDTNCGGFLTTYAYDWKMEGDQNKMIVTQARHTWVNAKASLIYPNKPYYSDGARQGVEFLQNVMWDKKYGGFFTRVTRQGKVVDSSKNAYGNAFAIFALAAYYKCSGDSLALSDAKKAFMWLEENSHDPIRKGYYQHLTTDGTPILRPIGINSTSELGYKDQNSSIHLLEAFTELYQVWPDALVRERLQEMLFIVRDIITTEKGHLALFFSPDWKPVAFRNAPRSVIEKHLNLDHVSFGHDVETAYLILEGTHVLGLQEDTTSLRVAKKMVDHALANGWDNNKGGFYDGGYYFQNEDVITIVKDSKNWWTQAEGLNALLMMAKIFPNDEQNYYQKFAKLWTYIDRYLIDHEYGDWYAGGIDKEPFQKTALKGHEWKDPYHQYRSLRNCVKSLRNETTV